MATSVHCEVDTSAVSCLVSIVVPVFNGMPFLPELVRGLLDQTYSNLEIILSDGGSTDGSLDYLQSLSDSRIQVISHNPGTSAAGNWTAACLAANGPYIKLICQDDVLYSNAIDMQITDLISQPSASMAIARRDVIDAHGKVLVRGRGLKGVGSGCHSGSSLIRKCFISGTNILGEPLAVLFRREALLPHLPWRDSNPLMLDLTMYELVAQGSNVVTRPDSIGAFRVSASSWSTRLATEQLVQTRAWQTSYVATHPEVASGWNLARAHAGRYLQTATRRLAYRYLRLSGRLSVPNPMTRP